MRFRFKTASLMLQRTDMYVLAALTASLPSFAMAVDDVTINNLVKFCVARVHLQNDEPSQRFDAFYNPATGRVENNAIYDADQEPLSRFEKCMAMQGFG
jgi:hypothetical protein